MSAGMLQGTFVFDPTSETKDRLNTGIYTNCPTFFNNVCCYFQSVWNEIVFVPLCLFLMAYLLKLQSSIDINGLINQDIMLVLFLCF